MKLFPAGFFWGCLWISWIGISHGREIFNFNIGGVSQGSLYMEEFRTDQPFQLYSFSQRDLTNLEFILGEIQQTTFPVPAILYWFQILKSGKGDDRTVSVLRTPQKTGGGVDYQVYGPSYLQVLSRTESGASKPFQIEQFSTEGGVRTLPEALLDIGLGHNAGRSLVFLDPGFYKRTFTLVSESPVSLEGFSKEPVTMSWRGSFWWCSSCVNSVESSFVDGDAPWQWTTLAMVVTAVYKDRQLQSYTVRIDGVPELAFYRVTWDKDRKVRAAQRSSTDVQLLVRNNIPVGGLNTAPNTLDSGYQSHNSASPLSGTNAMITTTGLHFMVEQSLMSVVGGGASNFFK